MPFWSPNGRVVYFHSSRNGRQGLYRKGVSGVGAEEELVSAAPFTGGVSPDGKLLAFVRPRPRKVWVLPQPDGPPGKTQPYQLLQSSSSDFAPAWSPDGHWLAFVSVESGRPELYAVPFPGLGSRVRVSTAGVSGDASVYFSPDGTQILFLDAAQKLVEVDVSRVGGALQVGDSHVLFSLGDDRFAVSPDGSRILASAQRRSGPITLVQNWTAVLRR